jgi:hypothetical protein
MRFIALALLLFSALLVSAQTSTTDASSTSELLAEIAKLPTCVVRMTTENRNSLDPADSHIRPLA